jgi:hypothetical protein
MGKICHFERRQKRFFFGTSLAFVLSSATKDMPGTPGLWLGKNLRRECGGATGAPSSKIKKQGLA